MNLVTAACVSEHVRSASYLLLSNFNQVPVCTSGLYSLQEFAELWNFALFFYSSSAHVLSVPSVIADICFVMHGRLYYWEGKDTLYVLKGTFLLKVQGLKLS